MSSQSHLPSQTPPLGRGRVARSATKPLGGIPYMSERQTQAYLMARDALRRVQRTASLVGAMPQMAADHRHRIQDDRRSSR